MLEKIFADNIKQIRKKWYKYQKGQIQFKMAQAQESGNEALLKELLREKDELVTREKQLR